MGLGSSLQDPTSTRTMVLNGSALSYKLSRTFGSALSPEVISSIPTGPGCTNSNTQCYHIVLYEQARRSCFCHLMHCCPSRHILLTSSIVPGTQNSLADLLSQTTLIKHKWALNQTILALIFNRLGLSWAESFAT